MFTRRDFLRLSASGAVAAALPAGLAAERPKRPNFLIILADDMGFSDAGCYGGEISTPNIDRLASRGVRFTQGYGTGRCWPSRSAILSGYYPQQIRMDPPKGRLPAWARLAPHHLKEAGYRCYHSGKWHIQGAPKVVAKGADFLAMRIRQIAMANGVPLVERKEIAQGLYRSVEVGQEVPPEFYSAVAEILAYVYRLSGRKSA